ncbi:ATP-binding cassette domain-containing protein [Thalassobacter stenotrophicus]|uniref:Sulfate/thiosulfate import ATP-binding protein CysA n=2 Tax=Thalassobacter stenotrophicus TaxID=266809 RepID=A0A0P1F0H3_9RHOB|nr:ATP-binding cassette domain-containing protein [Thalassobacter stenotrophicus]PVZ48080.1 ABC transporter ATP-binding protein [Thalassobacter stenotrophicus]CUH60918.1 Sulfate/thiosulfate import ATP-binding protein CysA [Thalassobacter stenotrophicus]SHI52450.1 putative thiamine transport system ATP-binding protein [Thalassobacter stenotrophicus DSM 16310]
MGLKLTDVTITAPGADAPMLAVSADVAPGAVLSIMGPSGVGKSTLLAWLTGTLPVGFQATGRAELAGRDITNLAPEARRLGILFQDHLLFPHLSVGANLAFGLAAGVSNRRDVVDQALVEIDLAGYADRDPATLSGGQRARVALMRMLLSEPEALLLDEPFSRLDAALRDQMRDLVFSRARAKQLPVIMVTHDAQDAEAAGGEVLHLRSGQAAR